MSESTLHLHAVGTALIDPEPDFATGVTPPRRRGGSGRFLTDVLVEERAITFDQLSHAIAER